MYLRNVLFLKYYMLFCLWMTYFFGDDVIFLLRLANFILERACPRIFYFTILLKIAQQSEYA